MEQLIVNYYHDCSSNFWLSGDTEGDLVKLCFDCAERYAHEVEWAQQGDHDSRCELCDALNNPESPFPDPHIDVVL